MKNRLKYLQAKTRVMIIVCLVLTLLVFIGMTVAYLMQDSKLENQFVVASVENEIQESFENNVKENVFIKNKGDIDVYIRLKVMPYFVDQNKNILSKSPIKDTDYTIKYPDKFTANWFELNGFYYYRNKLCAGNDSEVLFDEVKSINTDSGKFVFDIISESIQAYPEKAVSEAWSGIGVDENGKLEVKE